ncbi:MAG: FKBP-type peptidyl-prolyl cis-trans isomerase [Pseudomonadota bacterium]
MTNHSLTFALIGAFALSATPAVADSHSDTDTGTAEALTPGSNTAWLNSQAAFMAGLTAKDGWRPAQGGLMWRYVTYTANETKPNVSDTVTVHYEGTLTDGTVFDSSFERGDPATFPLRGLIPAWQIAIPEMGVGDTIEIAAPADIAYGPRGKGPIPPESVLLFKIELLGIQGR